MLKFDRRGRGAWASFLQARIKPWEYGLGDKAYVGQRQIITEWKGRNLSLEKQRFNKTVQHYRGRVEHLIGQVVDNRIWLCALRGDAWLVHPACRGHEDRGAHGWAPGAYEGT